MEQATSLELRAASHAIEATPYHPRSWLQSAHREVPYLHLADLFVRRAILLKSLAYPELAAGDLYKVISLCESHSRILRDKVQAGAGFGFFMIDSGIEPGVEESEKLTADLEGAQREAWKQLRSLTRPSVRLKDQDETLIGQFVPSLYPWTDQSHRERSDEVVEEINSDFAMQSSTCVVRRFALGDANGGRDMLGVSTTEDISEGDVVLVDRSHIWGCNGAGLEGTVNLHGGLGCPDPTHPSVEGEYDMRWIRDQAGKEAANVIARCKLLVHCIADDVAHPLDHHLAARLSPTYSTRAVPFNYKTDIVLPNMLLQQSGVDIFIDRNYDTWVLFTLSARIDNNAWSDSVSTNISPLFALFNHSCEPNVAWTQKETMRMRQKGDKMSQEIKIPDHTTIVMKAIRNIRKGEQLFVEYDSFLHDRNVAERREGLKRWLVDGCGCNRCSSEEAHESDLEELRTWDTDEKPALPEDLASQFDGK